jgi:hypothetical protein
MRVVTRYDKHNKKTGMSYYVYLLDESNRPLEAHYAFDFNHRTEICISLVNKYNLGVVEHLESYNIDFSSSSNYSDDYYNF